MLNLNIAPTDTTEPTVGMRMVKTGVSTGVTKGLVDGIEGSYQIDYTRFGDTRRWMHGIRIVPDPDERSEEISLAGDSRAVSLDSEQHLAGALHIGGEDGLGPLYEYGIAQPMGRVLEALDIGLPS